MRRILFLDIDGVLHGDADDAPLAQLPRLARCLLQMPALEIVVSSTWREDMTLADLCARLGEALAARIVDVTPVHDDGLDAGGRQREILAWLAAQGLHAGNARWLALDDWSPFFEPGWPALLLTDPALGFQDAQARALLAWYEES